MRRANRNLSNRADGATETIVLENTDPNVDQGLGKTFGVTVTNGKAANVAIALVPANYDTERLVASTTESGGVYTTTIARTLSITEGNVYTLLSRAYRSMKQMILDYEKE